MSKISIITPAYNAAPFVAMTIRSVLQQTIDNWEYIVINDGSTDETQEIIDGIDHDARVRVVCQTNHGMCQTRNIGYRYITEDSDYVMFLDADDVLEPAALETLSGYLDNNPGAGMVYCSFGTINEKGEPTNDLPFRKKRFVPGRAAIPHSVPSCPGRSSMYTIMSCRWAIPSCCLYRVSVFRQTRGWDEAYPRLSDDVDMALQINRHAEVHFLPLELVRYRRHASNVSLVGTVDRDRLLQERWWNLDTDDQGELLLTRKAIIFDRYLTGLFQLQTGWRELGHRDYRNSARFYLQGVNSLLRTMRGLARYRWSSKPL